MYYLIRISPYTRMCAKSLQSCLTLCNTMDCSLSGSSVHGILQARILEWVAIPSSRGSFQSTVEPVSFMSPALAGGFFKPHPHTHTMIHADGILPCQKNRPVFVLYHVVWLYKLWLQDIVLNTTHSHYSTVRFSSPYPVLSRFSLVEVYIWTEWLRQSMHIW